jgi:hypothetical protein
MNHIPNDLLESLQLLISRPPALHLRQDLALNHLPYSLFIWKLFADPQSCFIKLLKVFANRFAITSFNCGNPRYILSCMLPAENLISIFYTHPSMPHNASSFHMI